MFKKIIPGIMLLMSVALTASAQQFIPLDSWPYIYEDFLPGVINTGNNQVMEYDQLNINIIDGKVHYVADGVIMQADMANVHVVKIRKDYYLNSFGRMYKVLAETEHGAVLQMKEVDVDEMNKTSIGYGRSAVASTQNVSLTAIAGGDVNKRSLDEAYGSKYSGKELYLKEKLYLYVNGMLVRATKADVLTYAGARKDETKAFIKENKIKWKNVAKLSVLVEFLAGLSSQSE